MRTVTYPDVLFTVTGGCGWLPLRWLAEGVDGYFLEPDHVAGIVILQADVAAGGSLDLANRLAPPFDWRKVGCGRIELRNRAIDFDGDAVTFERDDHGPPLRCGLRRHRGTFGERIDRARPMP